MAEHKPNRPKSVSMGHRAGTPAIIERFPEHSKLIGMIVAQWSHIEYQLVRWLAFRMGISSSILEEMLYTLGSRARLNAIQAGLTSVNPVRMGFPVVFPDRKQEDRRKKALELYPDLDRKLTLRNRYAHAFFGLDNDTGDLIMIERMKFHEWRRLPINELKHQYDSIKELSDKLEIIVNNELLELLPKGAKTPAEKIL